MRNTVTRTTFNQYSESNEIDTASQVAVKESEPKRKKETGGLQALPVT